MTAVFDNMMDGTACVTGRAPWRWDDVVTDLGMRQADIAHQDEVTVVRRVADIEAAHRNGTVGIVFGLEAATPIENEIDRLDVLYGIGLRQIGIAYSDSNALGSGLAERVDGGLTALGHRAVRRMDQLGLAIDVSHSSDLTSLDVCRASEPAGPDDPRRLPRGLGHPADEARRRAACRRRRRAGSSACPRRRTPRCRPPIPAHSIASVMDHFAYCADLVGLEHVAFGPDTLYGDHVQLHSVFADLLAPQGDAPPHEKVPYVDGLENPTENFANICGWLVQHGYSDDEIRAVVGGNVLRALREIWV